MYTHDIATDGTTFRNCPQSHHLLAFSLVVPKISLVLSKCSYAEVRAEQRRELGIEESNPEVTADKVSHYL